MQIPFISQAYEGRSVNFESSRSINLFAEVSPSPNQVKTVTALFGTAGSSVWTTIGSVGVRGLHSFNNVLYVVAGANLYPITLDISNNPVVGASLGTLSTTQGRVFMEDNGIAANGVGGNQLMIVDGAYGYIYNESTTTFSQISSITGVQATANATISGGVLVSVQVLTAGAGYMAAPTVTLPGQGAYSFTVTMNGDTVASIAGAGSGGTDGTYTLTISAPEGSFFPPEVTSLAYIDGYFVVSSGMSIHTSQLYDGTLWSALAFTVAMATPENIQLIANVHQQLWAIKESSSEVLYDSGTATYQGSPFTRLSGGVVDFGTPSRYSVTVAANSLFFLATQKTSGGPVFIGPVMLNGYTPVPIAPAAIVYQMAQWTDFTAAFAYSYSEAGHTFVIFTSPVDNQTFVYDVTTGFWHEWSSYTSGTIVGRHFSNCYARFNSKHIVGDYNSGNLCVLDFSLGTENGSQIVSQRVTGQMADPTDFERVFISRLTIDADTGESNSSGNATLAWSLDSGHTWSAEYPASMGSLGAYTTRLVWRRLGYARSRVFRLTYSGSAPKTFLSAYIDGEA